MRRGYIKLHRKLLDSRSFQNEGLLKVWIWCLLKANHEGKWVPLKIGKGTIEVFVKPGQFIYGRNKAAKELRMKPSTIRNRMEKLKKVENLDILKDNQYSIITIINWDTYQGILEKEDTEKDNQRTTKGQPKDTNKNYKNYKNEKNKTYTASDDADGIDGKDFLMTRKKRKLNGKRFETFMMFWDAFDYKKGKREAADSWYDIPQLTDSLVEQIIRAAKIEANNRRDILSQGKTPKMAQGWISGCRWEDEDGESDYERRLRRARELDSENGTMVQ